VGPGRRRSRLQANNRSTRLSFTPIPGSNPMIASSTPQ
jgi:hypothetical protein